MTMLSETQFQAVLPDQPDALMHYFNAHIPTAKDDEIGALIDAYLAASADERRTFAEHLMDYQPGWFNTYALRMAMLSVRQHARDLLFKAFVAQLIAMATSRDEREDMMSLAPLFRSLTLLNANPADGVQDGTKGSSDADDAGRALSDVVQAAAQTAPNAKAQQGLERFTVRRYAELPLSQWGYTEIDGPSGIIYIWGKKTPPEQWST